MRVAIASDHAGFALKEHLVGYLGQNGHEIIDLGVHNHDASDYPDAAEKVAHALQEGQAERGILVCGSGVGVSVAANKFPGIYCAVCHESYSARQGVEHDRMNVIAMGARVICVKVAEDIAASFLNAKVDHDERHVRRFGKVQAIEERTRKSDA